MLSTELTITGNENGGVLKYEQLLPEKQKQVDKLVASFNPAKSTEIVTFGSTVQEQLGQYSRKILTGVQSKDAGQIGQILVALVSEVKSLKPAESKKKGIIANFFKEKRQQLGALKAQYETVDKNIEKVKKELLVHVDILLRDIGTYEELAEKIQQYHSDLTLYVIAIERKMQEIREMLPGLESAAESNRMEDVQNLRRANQILAELDRKKYDFEMSQGIAVQEAIQSRGIAAADTTLCTKAKSAVINTIPLWQTQAAVAIGLHNNQNAQTYLEEVSKVTSEMLVQNSQMFKQDMIKSAEERERGIVSVDAYVESIENIIDTFTELLNIQMEGQRTREEARQQIIDANKKLHNTLLNLKS